MIKLRAYYDVLAGSVEFRIIRRVGSHRQYLTMPQNQEWKTIEEAQSYPSDSALRIPEELFHTDFFDQFFAEIETCMKKFGALSKKQKEGLEKLQGLEAKLEAREYHLEDMRKLVFSIADQTPKADV